MLRGCNTCESGKIAVADCNPDLRYVNLVDEFDKLMKSICADGVVDFPLLAIHSQTQLACIQHLVSFHKPLETLGGLDL